MRTLSVAAASLRRSQRQPARRRVLPRADARCHAPTRTELSSTTPVLACRPPALARRRPALACRPTALSTELSTRPPVLTCRPPALACPDVRGR
eukprot:6921226-Prymnesium_polylepis.1